MILKYPTGFYREQIPEFVAKTNVTYNISDNPPVRSNISFQKIPAGVALMKIDATSVIRSYYGNLIYTISDGSSGKTATSQRIKSMGDFLEFSDVTETAAATITPEATSEISHDLNYYDYGLMGLTPDQINLMQTELNAQFETLTTLVNSLKSELAATKVSLQSNTKQLNEINGTINALKLTGSPTLAVIVSGLQARADAIISDNAGLEALAAKLSADIVAQSNNMRTIGALIK